MAIAKPPVGSKIRDWSGAPSLWLRVAGPERTFASDSGDVADAIGGTPAGVRSGGCTWADGPRGKCLAFDGSTGTVTLGIVAAPGPDITVMAWARSTSASGSQPIAATEFDGTAVSFLLSVGPASQSYAGGFSYYHEGWQSAPGGADLRGDGLWHHHAGVVSGATIAYYVDGVLVSSAATLAPRVNSATDTQVGYYPHEAARFPGQIDDFRIYPRALSAAEVARNFADPDRRLRARQRRRGSGPPALAPDGSPSFLGDDCFSGYLES